ncbi:hypothetical protein GIB67_038040 [Kingdonia uniflora]|uniref:Uncharacterized protein n=1 Tax=Kingdonia uniflora TaxID=39325 RepID=A0A7J7MC12_9MAGN|nr:hypothetical protein GIB67_038040 [Kingdonia uniflora]
MRRLTLAENAGEAQRINEFTDENATLRGHLGSADDQLYALDLHLRRGCEVRVVPLPLGGGTRTRQPGSGPQTRGGDTSRRVQGARDDFE